MSAPRCDQCAYWQDCPTVVKGDEKGDEKICGQSKMGGYWLHGQDGRAIITPAEFGCVLFKRNTLTP